MKTLICLLLMILVSGAILLTDSSAQSFARPSFEGPTQASGSPPLPWEPYGPRSTPDHQPGHFGVYRPAYHGEKYVALIFRPDRSTEILGQRLDTALQANTYYEFPLWLCHSDQYRPFGNFPARLRLLGRNDNEDPFVLWTSTKIYHLDWKEYSIRFKTPDTTVEYLYFQAHYENLLHNSGNVMIDHIGTITKLIAPQLALGNDTMLCEGESLLLTASMDSSEFVWQDGSTDRYFTVSEPGTYWVEATLGGITERDSIEVNYGYLPTVDLGADTTLCQGFELELRIRTQDRAVSFQWNNGDTLPDLTLAEAGQYRVIVSNGPCQSTDSIAVSFRDCSLILSMPNVITPNGDGINDAFVPIEIKDVLQPHMIIYDRWGRSVYTAKRLDTGWQGYDQGKAAPPGVYFWILYYRDVYGEEYVEKGSLSLLR